MLNDEKQELTDRRWTLAAGVLCIVTPFVVVSGVLGGWYGAGAALAIFVAAGVVIAGIVLILQTLDF